MAMSRKHERRREKDNTNRVRMGETKKTNKYDSIGPILLRSIGKRVKSDKRAYTHSRVVKFTREENLKLIGSGQLETLHRSKPDNKFSISSRRSIPIFAIDRMRMETLDCGHQTPPKVNTDRHAVLIVMLPRDLLNADECQMVVPGKN